MASAVSTDVRTIPQRTMLRPPAHEIEGGLLRPTIKKLAPRINQSSSANVAMTGSSPISISLTVADTDCTSHFFTPNARLINVRPAIQISQSPCPTEPSLYQPCRRARSANLPPAARIAHVFPDLASNSLLSIGQLCDAGCTTFFTKGAITIEFDGDTVLTGSRSPMTRL